MDRRSVRIVGVLVWALFWAAVLVLYFASDNYFDDWNTAALVSLGLAPQAAMGFVVNRAYALLSPVGFWAVFAPLAHSDCVASSYECISLAGMFGIGLGFAAIFGFGVILGLALRSIFDRRRVHHRSIHSSAF